MKYYPLDMLGCGFLLSEEGQNEKQKELIVETTYP